MNESIAESPLAAIRPATARDAADLARIYNHYIAHTVVSFEEEPVTPASMWSRVENVLTGSLPWLVAEVEGTLAGYAYAGRWKQRCAYRFTAETSIYLDHAMCGRGIGEALYRALLAELVATRCHSVIGGIALPNERSVRLHEKLGFRKVAHLAEVGRKFDAWVDVGYWQLLLEAQQPPR